MGQEVFLKSNVCQTCLNATNIVCILVLPAIFPDLQSVREKTWKLLEAQKDLIRLQNGFQL